MHCQEVLLYSVLSSLHLKMWAPDNGAKLSCRLPSCHHFYLLCVQYLVHA